MKNLTLIFAHPDDESFVTGGTIAKYAKRGWEVDLVCATTGQSGSWGAVPMSFDQKLGEVRQRELEEAGKVLGIASITLLDYVDGSLSKQTPGEIEDKLYKVLVDIRPDVVITFEPAGISNHPDHVKISLSTTFAYQKYAQRVESELPQKMFPKLYYACMPDSVVKFLSKEGVLPQQSFGKQWKGVPDRKITTVIDVSDFVTKKAKALWRHETQRDDVLRYFSVPTNPLIRSEYFIQRMEGTTEVYMGKHDRISHVL